MLSRSKRPVLKTDSPSGVPWGYEWWNYANKIGVSTLSDLEGLSICVKFKPGRRWKIKRMRVLKLEYRTYCECCGPQLNGLVHLDGQDKEVS